MFLYEPILFKFNKASTHNTQQEKTPILILMNTSPHLLNIPPLQSGYEDLVVLPYSFKFLQVLCNYLKFYAFGRSAILYNSYVEFAQIIF